LSSVALIPENLCKLGAKTAPVEFIPSPYGSEPEHGREAAKRVK
jgi:hypothetical protein